MILWESHMRSDVNLAEDRQNQFVNLVVYYSNHNNVEGVGNPSRLQITVKKCGTPVLFKGVISLAEILRYALSSDRYLC